MKVLFNDSLNFVILIDSFDIKRDLFGNIEILSKNNKTYIDKEKLLGHKKIKTINKITESSFRIYFYE